MRAAMKIKRDGTVLVGADVAGRVERFERPATHGRRNARGKPITVSGWWGFGEAGAPVEGEWDTRADAAAMVALEFNAARVDRDAIDVEVDDGGLNPNRWEVQVWVVGRGPAQQWATLPAPATADEAVAKARELAARALAAGEKLRGVRARGAYRPDGTVTAPGAAPVSEGTVGWNEWRVCVERAQGGA